MPSEMTIERLEAIREMGRGHGKHWPSGVCFAINDLLAEVQRLREERDAALEALEHEEGEVHQCMGDAYRAGQEAMRERAAAVCAARYGEHEQRLWAGPPAERITDRVGGMADEAEKCAEAILALEVE